MLFAAPLAASEPPPVGDVVSGDAVIRAAAAPAEIGIRTTSSVAGAIHSLKWNGVFRLRGAKEGVAPGEYAFRNFMLVGDLDTVQRNLAELARIKGYPTAR